MRPIRWGHGRVYDPPCLDGCGIITARRAASNFSEKESPNQRKGEGVIRRPLVTNSRCESASGEVLFTLCEPAEKKMRAAVCFMHVNSK